MQQQLVQRVVSGRGAVRDAQVVVTAELGKKLPTVTAGCGRHRYVGDGGFPSVSNVGDEELLCMDAGAEGQTRKLHVAAEIYGTRGTQAGSPRQSTVLMCAAVDQHIPDAKLAGARTSHARRAGHELL